MRLDSPVEIIPGVGPTIAAKLKGKGVITVGNVLSIVPIRYVDFSAIQPINSLRVGQWVAVRGVIREIVSERSPKKRMVIIKATIEDESGSLEVVWFNQQYISRILYQGRTVSLYGIIVFGPHGEMMMRAPEIQTAAVLKPIPHYSLRYGVEDGTLRRIISAALERMEKYRDPLPNYLREQLNMPDIDWSVRAIHQPRTTLEIDQAKTRLSLDELWTLMTAVAVGKKQHSTMGALAIPTDTDMLNADKKIFPFELTDDQERALAVILSDCSQAHPMRRLLNGDVGSGKTAVAMLVARQVIANGGIVVMVAPTTLLAKQHFDTWNKYWPKEDRVLLTSGSLLWNGQQTPRKQMVPKLASFSHGFISATHSVLQADIKLSHLDLVIVDEQHRFGVAQRAQMLSQGSDTVPHLLSMSATPIPRTAALVLYGDLDISVIAHKPHERTKTITRLMSDKGREVMYQFVDQQIQKGQQVYVVCPLVEQSAEDQEFDGTFHFVEERKAVKDEFDRLQKTVFAHRRIGLLYGKMKQADKDTILDQFRRGELDMVVTTTVIEVGVDVPNATIMLVEGAENFGLAQLHQLRGRVGRSALQSYCFLSAQHWTEAVKERLQLLVQYDDGFTLAEKDLHFRGPGELYGTLQAGVTPFRFASLANTKLIEQAQTIRDYLMSHQDTWSDELRTLIEKRSSSIHPE